MPWKNEWVEPALILIHRDVPVYATYDDGDIDQESHPYRFTLDTLCGEHECGCADYPNCRSVFDVRELPTWAEPPHPPFLTGEDDTPENRAAWKKYRADEVEEKSIIEVIRKAIDEGLRKPPPAEGSEASGSDSE